MGKTVEITADMVPILEYDFLLSTLHEMVKVHHGIEYDKEMLLDLLGYYPTVYNYFSSLYCFMINMVRREPKNADYRAKRDMLEQLLKDVRFQYDALSRKITVVTNEDDASMRAGTT